MTLVCRVQHPVYSLNACSLKKGINNVTIIGLMITVWHLINMIILFNVCDGTGYVILLNTRRRSVPQGPQGARDHPRDQSQ